MADGSPIAVLYKDDSLLAVFKPQAVSVHRSHAQERQPSLEELVQRQIDPRAILLHRLDRDTSGIVLFARNKKAAGPMSRAFAEGKIRKSYWAIVCGSWPASTTKIASVIQKTESGMWSGPASESTGEGARPALTTFRTLLRTADATWLEAIPKTGRTHQIRLHCAGHGHPIAGDGRYGDSLWNQKFMETFASREVTQALHCRRLDFHHPLLGTAISISAPVPDFWWESWLTLFPLELVKAKMP